MRLAVLLFFALLVAASLAGQVLAQEPPPPAPAPEPAGVQVSVEAVIASLSALATAIAAAVVAARKAWAAIQQLRAVVRGVEKAGDPAVKAAVHGEAERAGVEPGLAKVVQRETTRMKGGAA